MDISSKDKLIIILKELIIKILTLDYLVIKNVFKKELIIKNNEKVLDAGCGTGILSTFFPNANYTGIDLDNKLINFAKENYKKNFLVMSIDKLKFPANTFDKVIIVGVIHHLNDKISKIAFAEIKKVLKKGGKILVIEAIPPMSRYNLLGKLLRHHDEGEFVRTLDDYESLFKNKFKVIKKYEQPGGLFDYSIFLLIKSYSKNIGRVNY